MLILIFIMVFIRIPVNTVKTYILSEKCRSLPANDPLQLYSNTKHLRIDNLNETLILHSHPGFSSNRTHPSSNHTLSYPHGFSCEVVVYTGLENTKIMLKIEQFHIPSVSRDCVDNYLYVFDSNNAKSKAMPEAGGERGLCQSTYPLAPIFTTNAFICIAFHTSSINPTAIDSRQRPPGFRLVLSAVYDTIREACPNGGIYCGVRPLPNLPSHAASHFADHEPYRTEGGSLIRASREMSSSLGYCLLRSTLCDGVSNCENSRDEDPEHCNEMGFLSGFLSLGVPASIAIAVSTIMTFTVCIGTIICCCNRCCKPRSQVPRSPEPYFAPPHCARPFEKSDFTAWSNGGNCQLPIESIGTHLCLPHSNNFFNCTPLVSTARSASITPAVTLFSGGPLNVQYHMGTSRLHASTAFQSSFSTPDHLTLNSCSYTPPPHGGCFVPHASSASSRTGTASGRSHIIHARQSNHMESSANADEPRRMRLGQQLGGSGRSALHTNTPVEIISQSGVDISANGGIVYLGEVGNPCSDNTEQLFGGLSSRPGSTTTASGSSHGMRYSHRGERHEANGHRRSKAPSSRRRRYRQMYPGNVCSRTASSGGSHTPTSSRSGLPLSLRSLSDTADPNFQGHPPSSASFSVQL